MKIAGNISSESAKVVFNFFLDAKNHEIVSFISTKAKRPKFTPFLDGSRRANKCCLQAFLL